MTTPIKKIIGTVSITLLLSGCAAMQSQPTTADRGELYDGEVASSMLGVADAKTEQEALMKGMGYWAQGNGDKALLYYIRALELNEHSETAAANIAIVHQQRNNLAMAQQAWHATLAINPHHVMALEAIGLLHLKQRDYEQAKHYLLHAIRQYPIEQKAAEKQQDLHYQPWMAFNGLGVIADLEKQYSQALTYYQQALALSPAEPMILNNIGYSHLLNNELEAALPYFQQALQTQGNYVPARHNLALLYARQNQPDLAVQTLTPVMGKAAACNDVGYLMMLNNELASAEQLFKRAIRLSPSYYREAWENLDRLTQQQKGELR